MDVADIVRPEPGLVAALGRLATGTLANALDAVGATDTILPTIKSVAPGMRCAGPAVTVRETIGPHGTFESKDFAVGAIILRLFGYSMAPMILGFVLGRLMEENLRRALEIYDGYSFLWERPITLGIMILTALILLSPIMQWFKDRRAVVTAGEGG